MIMKAKSAELRQKHNRKVILLFEKENEAF